MEKRDDALIDKATKRATKWQSLIGIISATVGLVIALIWGFVEFSDKWEDRREIQYAKEQAQREEDQERISKQQAAYLSEFVKEDMERIIKSYDDNMHVIMEEMNRKDSLLLLFLPSILDQVTGTKVEVDKLKHKFDIILGSENQSEKVDFVKLLNERDSIVASQALSDAFTREILKQIRLENMRLMRKEQPKFGDRIR